MERDLIRFGCHDFLNIKPLINPIVRGEIPHRFSLTMDTPARLSDLMQQGLLDLAWIPSIAYAALSECLIIPGFSISSFHSVKSVLLISKKEIRNIQKIALDQSSRTSVAMIRIILKEYGITPGFITLAPDFQEMMKEADAALIIGDNALGAEKGGYRVYDLGEEWYRLTGLPFVHALLLVKPNFSLGDQLAVLHQARKIGLSRTEKIIDEESDHTGLDKELLRDYLEKRIYYDLGEKEIAGLKTFYLLARREGLIEKETELRFYEE
jgi:chorismate dehydratase